MTRKVVTLTETASLFGLSLDELWRLIKSGQIKAPETSLSGRVAFYYADSLPEVGHQLAEQKMKVREPESVHEETGD